ncbi:MAG: bifunctional phosphoribosylaminoimidazolecarboxamide formyltransferase/IMP cyclohydrolase [Bacillota bacterium]|nr:bifunctional phosphoribosylaminoimidazolecarboxamide formyltransferase/IMP cyclohydrolase [Bacillota bacterium]
MARRALLSVYDKEGLVELGRGLVRLGWELISTGGTAARLAEAGVPVRDIAAVTGFPEILDGRVKTLHPAVFGGILARRDVAAHREQLAAHGLETIDLVVSNLYPFRATVGRPGVTLDDALENIDIGGVSLIRAAAKNHRDVLIATDPREYGAVLEAIERGEEGEELRYRLACAAFAHTAAYDAVVSTWLAGRVGRGPRDLPDQLVLYFEKALALSYGENPHQPAAMYREPFVGAGALAGAQQLQGKPLSFNNLNDAEGALAAVREFRGPAAVAVKHATPCGVAIAETVAEACNKAHDADPVSIYGGILAVNRTLDGEAAEALRSIHLDVLVAPGYTEEALRILVRKPALRVLTTGEGQMFEAAGAAGAAGAGGAGGGSSGGGYDLRRIGGGLLVQLPDVVAEDPGSWQAATKRTPTAEELQELAFAWRVVKHVRSNAIVLARHGATIGIGGGQTNRVESARIAVNQAGARARGSVLASDAFIPFPDTIEVAATAGIAAVVQPGGSIRDADVIEAADQVGLAMVFTGVRHLRH